MNTLVSCAICMLTTASVGHSRVSVLYICPATSWTSLPGGPTGLPNSVHSKLNPSSFPSNLVSRFGKWHHPPNNDLGQKIGVILLSLAPSPYVSRGFSSLHLTSFQPSSGPVPHPTVPAFFLATPSLQGGLRSPLDGIPAPLSLLKSYSPRRSWSQYFGAQI